MSQRVWLKESSQRLVQLGYGSLRNKHTQAQRHTNDGTTTNDVAVCMPRNAVRSRIMESGVAGKIID